MRRVRRTALHKDSNHARVDAYTTHLEALFNDWLSTVDTRGYSTGTLVTRLDDAAQQWFPRAFAIGRHQAYPKQRPGPGGQEVLTTKILSNRHFLQNSLAPDIDARAARFRATQDGSLADALRQSFSARIRNQYGGAIWQTTEAGYRAGVAQAKGDLARRMHGPLLAQEDDEEEQPQPGDEELALALGITVVALLGLVALGRSRSSINSMPGGPTDGTAVLEPMPGVLDAAGVSVMLDYNAEDDENTCDPCSENAAGSPYTDEECPLPGEDCDGRGSCRCELSTVVDDGSAAAEAA